MMFNGSILERHSSCLDSSSSSRSSFDSILRKMKSNEKLITTIVESVMRKLHEFYAGGSTKLICIDCFNKIRNGKIFSGKHNQYKWTLLSDQPVDYHVWENCHKCQSFSGGRRFEAKVAKQNIVR